MAICPYCKAEIEDGAKFCTFCGEKLEQPAAPAGDQINPVPQDANPLDRPAAQSAEPVLAAQSAEPAPAAAVGQSAYAQPVYPEQKKKSKKWLIPVIILAALALIGCAVLAVNFIKDRIPGNDPNIGVYKATAVSMAGLELDPDTIFDGGFVLELQAGGKCKIKAGDASGYGNWKIDDGVITIDDGSSTIEGKIDDGVITIENMLDTGVNITLNKVEDD